MQQPALPGRSGDLAVKFSLATPETEAGREYPALLAPHRAGCALPRPLLLDRTSTRAGGSADLAGRVASGPPADDASGPSEHLAAVHSLRPPTPTSPSAPTTAYSAEEAVGLVRGHLERIPEDERPASLTDIFRQLGTRAFPQWPAAAPRLCRTDANISNFIRRPEGWYSVDWENSGWGDPAFEVADLMSHPAYITVPCERWPWVARTYCRIAGDRAMLVRIRPTTASALLLVSWPATCMKYPEGWTPGWSS